MSNVKIALDCIARGWHVFPCKPRTKHPATQNGFKDATADEAKVRSWWERWPDANVAIATGASGLTVLDIDHGVDAGDWATYAALRSIPMTYAVRTGRRDGYGIQLYFTGTGLRSIPWSDSSPLSDGETVKGDIRSATGYVMAEGCTHPSGALYERVVGHPGALAEVPLHVRTLKAERGFGAVDDGAAITESRNNALTSIAGKMRAAGVVADLLEANLLATNAARCVPPLPDEEVRRIAANASRWEPQSDPAVVIGGAAGTGTVAEAEARPRPCFMTLEDFDNVQPPEFLIRDFLAKGAIAMLAGPVAQRKTLVAMNVVHALCTGEPLFGHFEVVERPRRVYYLCPEMGASEFVERLKNVGLRQYVGESLFCLTMNQPPIRLEDLDDLDASVVVVDTLTRYVDGDENSSTEMRVFAAQIMAMIRGGATVLLLHHSKKGSSGSLDDGLRGSSELAAFVTSCWVTGLKDLQKPYESQSSMRNVKQRDFKSEPFVLNPVLDSVQLIYAGKDEPTAEVNEKAKDSLDAAVLAIYQAEPCISVDGARKALAERGIRKGTDPVRKALAKARNTGVAVSEGGI